MTLVRTETRELRRRAGQWLAEKVRTCRWVGRLANNAELRWTAAVLARTQGRVCISVWYTRIYTCRKGTVVCNLMPNCAQTTCMHWAHWWRARVHTMACTVSHHASLPMRPHVVHASGSATWPMHVMMMMLESNHDRGVVTSASVMRVVSASKNR